MPVGYRYLLETGNKKPFCIFTVFTASTVLNTLRLFERLWKCIPGILRIALPFAVMGSAVLSVAASIRLFMSARRGQLIVSLIPEVLRLLILPIIMNIITTDVKSILGAVIVLVMAVLCFSAISGGTAGASSGSSGGSAFSKNAAFLLNKLTQRIDSAQRKQHALHEHNKGTPGYFYINNDAQLRAIRNDEREIERLQKLYDKLK